MSDESPEAAALEEVERQQTAQAFEMPTGPLEGMGFGGPARAPSFGATPGAPSTTSTKPGEPQQLEDLYELYPEIGGGEYKMRVERTWPKMHSNVPIAGHLEDLFERVSQLTFREMFGGGKYTVTAMAPVQNGEPTADGYRRLKKVKLVLPGEPTWRGVKDESEQMGYNRLGVIPQVDPSVARAEIQADADRERRRDEERRELTKELRDQSHTGASSIVDSLQSQHGQQLEDVRDHHSQQITYYQQELDQMRAQMRAKDDELTEARRERERAQIEARENFRNLESDRLREQEANSKERIAELKEGHDKRERELKDRHDDERRRRDEAQNGSLTKLTEDHRKELGDITTRNDERWRDYQAAQQLERERVRDEAKNRVEQIERDAKMRVDALEKTMKERDRNTREDYDRRRDDMFSQHARELKGTREQYDQRVEAIRDSANVQSTFIEKTSEFQLTTAQTELNRLREDADVSRRDAEEARRELHKTPLEAIEQATGLAGMIGWAPAKDGSGDETIAQKAFGLAQQAIDKAPEFFKNIGDARAQQQQQQQGQPQWQQVPPQMAQPQQMAAGPYQQQQPSAAAYQQQTAVPFHPEAPAAAAPPPMSGMYTPGVASSPIQPSQPMAPQWQGSVQPVQPVQAQPPQQPQASMVSPIQPLAPPPAATPAAAPTAAPAAPAAPEGIKEFLDELEKAIQSRVVTEEQFARGVIERVGPQQTAGLVGTYRPEDIFTFLAQTPEGQASATATRAGQRYVRGVWAIAGHLLGQQQQAQALQPQQAAAPQAVTQAGAAGAQGTAASQAAVGIATAAIQPTGAAGDATAGQTGMQEQKATEAQPGEQRSQDP